MFGSIGNKETRGYMLKIVKIGYPQPVGSNLLDTCLIDAGMPMTRAQIEGHLQYLEEKGYITTTKSTLEIIGTPIILARLTSKGIDLLEKTISDPGVIVK